MSGSTLRRYVGLTVGYLVVVGVLVAAAQFARCPWPRIGELMTPIALAAPAAILGLAFHLRVRTLEEFSEHRKSLLEALDGLLRRISDSRAGNSGRPHKHEMTQIHTRVRGVAQFLVKSAGLGVGVTLDGSEIDVIRQVRELGPMMMKWRDAAKAANPDDDSHATLRRAVLDLIDAVLRVEAR